MTGDCHVQFYERLKGKFLRPTHLKKGVYVHTRPLCDTNKVTAKYVKQILRLNFLAPKLKEAILLGHQPRHMKLADLMQNIPSLWHEQGELFGCDVF